MDLCVRKMTEEALEESVKIWNEVVQAGCAFPQTEPMTPEEGRLFFAGQSYTAAAFDEETGEVVGMYILHPNNIGRCGHICNASYAVRRGRRGEHIGEALVEDCLKQAKNLGFKIIQFNAVVKSNEAALKLYKKMGFHQLGTIPGGFCNISGEYEDIILHYKTL